MSLPIPPSNRLHIVTPASFPWVSLDVAAWVAIELRPTSSLATYHLQCFQACAWAFGTECFTSNVSPLTTLSCRVTMHLNTCFFPLIYRIPSTHLNMQSFTYLQNRQGSPPLQFLPHSSSVSRWVLIYGSIAPLSLC